MTLIVWLINLMDQEINSSDGRGEWNRFYKIRSYGILLKLQKKDLVQLSSNKSLTSNIKLLFEAFTLILQMKFLSKLRRRENNISNRMGYNQLVSRRTRVGEKTLMVTVKIATRGPHGA